MFLLDHWTGTVYVFPFGECFTWAFSMQTWGTLPCDWLSCTCRMFAATGWKFEYMSREMRFQSAGEITYKPETKAESGWRKGVVVSPTWWGEKPVCRYVQTRLDWQENHFTCTITWLPNNLSLCKILPELKHVLGCKSKGGVMVVASRSSVPSKKTSSKIMRPLFTNIWVTWWGTRIKWVNVYTVGSLYRDITSYYICVIEICCHYNM